MLSSPISTLLGSLKPSTNPYDLITGEVGDVTTSFTPASFTKTELTNVQDTALQSLKDYVTDNVKGDSVDKLMAQIAAVEVLMKLGNEEASNADPVFALLSGNSAYFSKLSPGSLLNQLF